MNLTMNSTITELSVHACAFVLKVLDREEPGARVWPKWCQHNNPLYYYGLLNFWKKKHSSSKAMQNGMLGVLNT